MEYSIYINQPRAIEWNLTYSEAIICSFYSQPHDWVKTRIKDEEGDYLCIALAKLIKELPFIGNTKTPFSKALNSLVSKYILQKIVDEDNSRVVFYRMNPSFKIAWKYHEAVLSTDLKSRFLLVTGVTEMLEKLSNDNDISKRLQVLSNDNEVLSNDNEVLSNDNEVLSNDNEVLPNDNLSNNIISYNHNQSNHNHNYKNDELSLKKSDLEQEFEKLLSFYPQTINNKPKHIAQAFGVYQTFNNAKKMKVLKAVKHYAKTEYVNSKQSDTKFIPSIHSFLTKSNLEEILKLPLYKEFSESFEKKSKEVGSAGAGNHYNEEQSIEYLQLCTKFEKAKELKVEDEEAIKLILADDFEIFCEEVGLVCLPKFSAEQLAESLLDIKEERKGA